MVETYASNISQLSDDAYIDVSEYKFHPSEIPMPIALTPSNGIKLVRFKDNLIEEDPVDLAARQQLMNGASHFKPYTDSDDGQGGDSTDTSSIASSFDALSNQQIFAQHQQQILDQDNDLGFLLDSVRRQHQMGLNMNEELDEHIILLNDLESGVDRAYTRLGQAQNRLKNFQKLCKENGSLVTICVLTVILIVLLIVLN